jgi:hypothetical protein
MVWLVEKKVFHYIYDLGYEGVAVPVRAKFEFEIREGGFVPQSLNFEHLYNKEALRHRYPNLNSERLEADIRQMVIQRIYHYLRDNGYVTEAEGPDDIL